jgi:hypothetical protein
MPVKPGDTQDIHLFDEPTLRLHTDMFHDTGEEVLVVQDGSITLVGITLDGGRTLRVHRVYNNASYTDPAQLCQMWIEAHTAAIHLAARFMNFGD